MLFNLSRRSYESNSSLGETILKASWFRGQSYRSSKSFLSAALRSADVSTIAASSSAYSFSASTLGIEARNINKTIYIREQLLPAPSGTTQFLTRVVSSVYGCAYIKGMETSFTVASGLVTFNTFTDNTTDRPVIDWVIPLLQETASALYLTSNFPHEVPDLVLLSSRKVNVLRPSTQILKESFDRTSPSLKWKSYPVYNDSTGLAIFDF